MQVPLFCAAAYEAIAKVIDGELAVNLFCENAESAGSRSPVALLKAPGKEIFCQVPEAGVTSEYTVNGRTFIAGSQLYEVDAAGAVTVRGSLGGTQPLRPCQMTSNETQLLALNNGNLYVLTLATNAFIVVNMAQLQGGANSVSQIGFADGYGVAWFLNTHTFQVSSLEDFTTWSGLDVTTNSLFPDNFVTMICDHREIWFFSAKKSVGYYNAGAGNPPFIPIQGAFAEFGAAALSATVQLDNSVFWIGQDERGTGVAYRLEGYSERRVSTHAVEFAWQGYTTVTDARAYTYQEEGHSFWVIFFPSANKTWCYDVSTQLWHERGSWNTTSGVFDADHSQSHTFNFGKHLVGDWASGNVYHQSASILTDNGNILKWMRRSPTQNDENHFIYFSDFEVDMQIGTGPQPPLTDGNGNPRQPQVILRWSDDGGFTWSNSYYLNCGYAGEYGKRVRKTMLGRARKRVWELSGTDPVQSVVVNGYCQAQQSLEGQSE